MKFIQRIIGVVSYDRMTETMEEMVASLEFNRNLLRKDTLNEINTLDPIKDGEKIQRLLLQMNRDLTLSYEKETSLREFVNKLK